MSKIALRAACLALPFLLAACSSGSTSSDGAPIDLNNLPTTLTSIKLRLACPATIAAGSELDGFSATFTDSQNQPIANAFVGVSASTGAISAPPGFPNSGGAPTDRFGLMRFSLKAPADALDGSFITIRAQASVGTATSMDSCKVTIGAPNFSFTNPLAGSAQIVGSSQAVTFSWVDRNGLGVAGGLRLSATSGSLSFGTAGPGASQLSTKTNSSGSLVNDVFFTCAIPGIVQIRAVDVPSTGLTTSVSVQCLTQPDQINLDVDNLLLKPSPDANRRAKLTVTTYDARGRVIKGLPITFELAPGAGGGERLVPRAGITNDAGQVTAGYEAGTTTGTVTIRACVSGTAVCDTRDLTISGAAGGGAAGVASKLTMSCQPKINRGATLAGFLIKSTDAAGTGVGGVTIGFSTTTGRIDAPPDQPGTFSGTTDAGGNLAFAFGAPADVVTSTSVTIRGTSNVGGNNLSSSCAVTVVPDAFMLTAPVFNSQQKLGNPNAQAIQLSWKNGSGAGVAGQVRLTSDGNSQILTNGGGGTANVLANTDASGALIGAYSLTCTGSGTVQLRAEDASSNGRNSIVSVACIDPPQSVRLDASQLTVDKAPSGNRFSNLTINAFGESGQSLKNTQIVLTLSPASGSLDATTGNTLGGGPINRRYEAGTATGVVTITACVQGTTVCDAKNITVQ